MVSHLARFQSVVLFPLYAKIPQLYSQPEELAKKAKAIEKSLPERQYRPLGLRLSLVQPTYRPIVATIKQWRNLPNLFVSSTGDIFG
jgi:hypothetical protein